jgi:hypothetical protein
MTDRASGRADVTELQPLNAAWIEARICVSRNERVLPDADLARIYGVETRRLVEQLKRNEARFPPGFAWQLDEREASALRSQFAISNVGRGGRRYRPWVFTEHRAILLANVLKSPAAVLASAEVVHAFARLRSRAAETRGPRAGSTASSSATACA